MSTKYEEAVDRLCTVYRESDQIGLVAGAGVGKDSGVPLYRDLALQVLELAREKRALWGAPREALEFLSSGSEGKSPDPDHILQFVADHLTSTTSMEWLAREVLYAKIERRTHKMVARHTFRKNDTLDAVISLCAAIPGSDLAGGQERRWSTNRKVGAILTTNYDNLVEGSFGTKYGASLLKPVPGDKAREAMRGKRVIPVYHMHGYVSYVDDPDRPDEVRASDLVIAEEDYYETFYNLLGFSNVVATSVLRRFPCLFVGCSMADRNVRRILYHLQRERILATEVKEHFALLSPKEPGQQAFEDAILASFGVTTIRLKDAKHLGSQVKAIVQRLYLSAEGVTEAQWRQVEKGGW
jgi:hypothetical protein